MSPLEIEHADLASHQTVETLRREMTESRERKELFISVGCTTEWWVAFRVQMEHEPLILDGFSKGNGKEGTGH